MLVTFFMFQKQLAQFDSEADKRLAEAEMDAVPSLEIKHAHARLEMRERQLRELAGTMKDLTTEEVRKPQLGRSFHTAFRSNGALRNKLSFFIFTNILIQPSLHQTIIEPFS